MPPRDPLAAHAPASAFYNVMGGLFGEDVYLAEAVPALVDDQLFPAEREYIRGAVPKRRAEFGTARVCARRALVALGADPIPLVPGADRAPTWPSGVVGSISHTDGYCVAAVTRSPPARSIGLDVETLRVLDPSLAEIVLTPRERAWLRDRPASSRSELGLLCFSAKEAFYKCQYRVTGTFLDFLDVEIQVAQAQGRFDVRVLEPGWRPNGASGSGRFAFEGNRVMCGILW